MLDAAAEWGAPPWEIVACDAPGALTWFLRYMTLRAEREQARRKLDEDAKRWRLKN